MIWIVVAALLGYALGWLSSWGLRAYQQYRRRPTIQPDVAPVTIPQDQPGPAVSMRPVAQPSFATVMILEDQQGQTVSMRQLRTGSAPDIYVQPHGRGRATRYRRQGQNAQGHWLYRAED